MYTLSKGPSKFVAKARRVGLSQKIERLDSRDHSRRTAECNGNGDESQIMNQPKPVFNSLNRKFISQRSQQEEITPQHEELVNFVYDSWNTVFKEIEAETPDKNQNTKGNIAFFESPDECQELQDFKPFDLEGWWGKRLFSKITESL
ncbi:MAPK regulated corepressor interacting protein 2-like [Neocloeon triangulifer]|uniref:MAPK regulated corepressor interacting protein 2-like n=1 Tax=Neocloeon triangulifer TaxID=2078957 RepID=UPI00286F968B|nr:MAPK regulated corepressor interacting protein 2-like [Neocloeon triangulifer]